MIARRGFVLALAVVAFAAWLAILAGGGFTPSARPSSPVIGAASPLDPIVRDIQSQSGRLRTYLAGAPPLARPSRNPFRFNGRADDLPARRPSPALSTAAATLPAARPGLTLSGLAEDPSPSGAVRTAVITAEGQLYLVKEGETFARRFRVVRISADAVQVLDLTDGTTLTLALK